MNPNTWILVSEVHGTSAKSATRHMTYTSQDTSHDSNKTASMGEVRDMDEDGPNGSPYEMLEKHDQSETKRDITSFSRTMPTSPVVTNRTY